MEPSKLYVLSRPILALDSLSSLPLREYGEHGNQKQKIQSTKIW